MADTMPNPARPAPPAPRYKNFDTLRRWGAIAVMVMHGIMIGEGDSTSDAHPIALNFGHYGVELFFILSGFLVTRSWLNSSSAASFAWKRFLRIYPAYLASILIVTLIVAPFFTHRSLTEYFTIDETWRAVANGLHFDWEDYWVTNLTFYPEGQMNGVLNGVLWTIQAEILLYLSVAILGLLRLLRMPVVIGISLLFVVLKQMDTLIFVYFSDSFYLNWWTFSLAAPGFFAGSFLFFLFRYHKPNAWIALVLAALAIASQIFDISQLGLFAERKTDFFAIFAAYPVLWLGHEDAPDLGNWTRYGDLSYGIYIFHWPLFQVLRHFTGSSWNGWIFFAVGLVLSAGIALLSWNFVEKPAMTLRRWRPAFMRRPDAGA